MLVKAFKDGAGHDAQSWSELVRKCGYKAVVVERPQGALVVEIKPDNSYSKLVPTFEQLYSDEFSEREAVEDLCRSFAHKFLSKSWRVIEAHRYHEWTHGKLLVKPSPYSDV